MSSRITTLAASAAFMGAALGLATSASAQQTIMQECGANWTAAKAAGSVPAGQTWPQFLSQCRAAKATPAAAAAPAAAPAPAAVVPPVVAAPVAPAVVKPPVVAAPAKPVAPVAVPAPVAGAAVFPNAIDAKYSTLKAGKQRESTCLDQYKANKATGGNGGLNWIQKGGGYYSQCNKLLKGA